jgi:hypothetical protein
MRITRLYKEYEKKEVRNLPHQWFLKAINCRPSLAAEKLLVKNIHVERIERGIEARILSAS